MTGIDWALNGPFIATCSCAYGCPCQFNALPTNGDCRAAVAMRVDEGHFDGIDLAGAKFVAEFAWPGAIHEGHGEALIVLDESLTADQCDGLLTILSGRESEPGATVFNVFATTLETVHEPLLRPIRFEADIAARTGRFSVPGIVDAMVEPIRNPVTGDEHQARMVLPHGFEYHEAEVASSTTRAMGTIPLDWSGRHSHLYVMHMTPRGPLHA